MGTIRKIPKNRKFAVKVPGSVGFLAGPFNTREEAEEWLQDGAVVVDTNIPDETVGVPIRKCPCCGGNCCSVQLQLVADANRIGNDQKKFMKDRARQVKEQEQRRGHHR